MTEPGTASAAAVRPAFSGNTFSERTEVPPCNAGIKLDNDGNIYSKQSNGTWSQVGTWLLSGAAAGFWASSTVDSGTLDTDAGAAFLVLTSDREYSVLNNISSSERITFVTLKISSDSSGSPVVATRQYRILALVGLS